MITNKGKELLVKYLAGKIENWAAAIEVGIGETAAAATDTSLEFPYLRFKIDHLDYDEVNSKVLVRATIPQDIATSIYEVGLFTSENFPSPVIGSRLFSDFSQGSTVFVDNNASFTTVDTRLGNEGLLISAGSGQTGFVRGYIEVVNLENYKGSDSFNFAYNYTDTGGTPTVAIRFETSTSGYFEHTFTPTAGYNIETFTKTSLAAVGGADWNSIGSIYVATNDQSDILLDGIMIEESLILEDYGMVARNVLTTPRAKPAGVEADMTFEVELTF